MSTPGFFTQGVMYDLPHPPIPLQLLLIVHAVVERACKLCASSRHPVLHSVWPTKTPSHFNYIGSSRTVFTNRRRCPDSISGDSAKCGENQR